MTLTLDLDADYSERLRSVRSGGAILKVRPRSWAWAKEIHAAAEGGQGPSYHDRFFEGVLVGWEGVGDEDGTPIPFTRFAVAQVAKRLPVDVWEEVVVAALYCGIRPPIGLPRWGDDSGRKPLGAVETEVLATLQDANGEFVNGLDRSAIRRLRDKGYTIESATDVRKAEPGSHTNAKGYRLPRA